MDAFSMNNQNSIFNHMHERGISPTPPFPTPYSTLHDLDDPTVPRNPDSQSRSDPPTAYNHADRE